MEDFSLVIQNSESQSSTFNNNQIFLYVAIGILFVLLIGFYIFNYFRKKNKNKKQVALEKEIRKSIKLKEIEHAVKIKLLIERNEKLIKDFVPSIGKFKMSDIIRVSKIVIKELVECKEFKDLKNSGEASYIFDENLKALYNTRSNNWTKKHQNSVDYFQKQALKFVDNENYEDLLERENIYLDMIYNNELTK